MTPFNGAALLAMLLTFYPVVGPAALARARQERPAYFAGGRIIGTHGDALELPDGRIFDLIVDVLGPNMRWWVHFAPKGGPRDDTPDPFRLEDGPLTPIDESAFPPPVVDPVFVPLVAGALGDLGRAGGVLDGAHSSLTLAAVPGDLDAALGGELGAAADTLSRQLDAAGAFVPADVAAHTRGQGAQLPADLADYTRAAPAEGPPRTAIPRPPGNLPGNPADDAGPPPDLDESAPRPPGTPGPLAPEP